MKAAAQMLVSVFLLASAPAACARPARVVFFGDSITEIADRPAGYLDLMRQDLKAAGKESSFEIIGSGTSGDKIYDLFLRADQDVIERRPDTVFVWVGVNDVWHKELHRTGTDIKKFERFYGALIRKLQGRGIRVILVTPMAIGERPHSKNALDGDLNAYSDIIRALAGRFQCGLVDLRKEFLAYAAANNPGDQESGILTRDRVHPTDRGNRFIADAMLRALQQR